jgi:hypothetical protein
MVAKSFLRKQVLTKNFHEKFFGRTFFLVEKSLPRKQVTAKHFHQKLLPKCFMVVKLFV